ncbi:MAG: glycosyltransferase family 2 protein [Bacteroidota bacterium]
MKVAGFTIARNLIQADYPLREALYSVLPLCDEMVIAVGNSEDDTKAYIESFQEPKIRLFDTIWDDTKRVGGAVLADETNKAMDRVSAEADWLIYIQADECLHEKYLPAVRLAMEKYLHDNEVDALLFDYLHFYGNYTMVGDSRRWYRQEIRVVKNHRNIRSWKDAQGFRTADGKKLRVAKIDACIYHYGWVKHPRFQQQKQAQFHRLWHDDQYMEKNVLGAEEFDYGRIDSLQHFTGTHPAVMQERIDRMDWTFDVDPTKKNFGMKARLLHWIEERTGWRVGEYKNFIRIR